MPINVLLVDDSPTVRALLCAIIERDFDMRVVGQAVNGIQAIQMVEELQPDVVLMDVMMPQMDGIEATRRIMDVKPTPIVIISSAVSSNETKIAFEAINAGALTVLQKLGVPKSQDYETGIKELLDTLRAMSQVRVIRHSRANRAISPKKVTSRLTSSYDVHIQPEIVSIAASTGGPQVLGEILKSLPPNFKLPIVIVQHITPEFVTPFVTWLNSISQLPVRIAEAGERPQPGTIYLAPGQRHLQVTSNHCFEFSDTPSNVVHIPSADVLLESVAQHYGSRAIGIILTGMGSDGANGLKAMCKAGAMTIAQDEASCVVFGMPYEAIALGAARQTLPPIEITKLLLRYTA